MVLERIYDFTHALLKDFKTKFLCRKGNDLY